MIIITIICTLDKDNKTTPILCSANKMTKCLISIKTKQNW